MHWQILTEEGEGAQMKVLGGLYLVTKLFTRLRFALEVVLEISPLPCLCLLTYTQGDILSGCSKHCLVILFCLFSFVLGKMYTVLHYDTWPARLTWTQIIIAVCGVCMSVCPAAKKNFQGRRHPPCAGPPVARTRFSSLIFKILHSPAR